MLRLIQNENMKIYRRIGTIVMIGLLVLAAIGFAVFTKYSQSDTIFGSTDITKGWKDKVEKDLKEDKKEYKKEKNKDVRELLKEDIIMNQYRLDHNIPPEKGTVWEFMAQTDAFTSLIGLFTTIVGAISVAGEFTWGTIKLLLIRSASRSKILFSKFVATIGFAIGMIILLFIVSLLVGLVLFGSDGFSSAYLTYVDGKVIEKSMGLHIFSLYGLSSVDMLTTVIFAFMISAVFRSSSLAIGLSIFLSFVGGTIMSFMSAMNINWGKYLFFANTNFRPYITDGGEPPFKGMTFGFSITVLSVYLLIFLAISWYVFNKRDVASSD
ncbi:ABC transporter permease [Marininema mesophilum]|nr:ABC transporter permease subunit [Marininema mesophilum]